MDYCRLELFVYRNSQYFLVELLDNLCLASQGVAEYEKLVDSYYPQVPYSEERLALFVMAFIGMDLADVCWQGAFERGKRRAMIWMQKRFVRTQGSDSHQCMSVKIVASLLGVKAHQFGVGIY